MGRREETSFAGKANTKAKTVKQLNSYKVRKDNTICYKSNFYSLPLGTYKDKDSGVLIDVAENKLAINTMAGEQICTHNLSPGKGKTIRNTDHCREKSKTLEEYQKQVLDIFGQTETAKEYLGLLHKDKSRYYRDNLQYIIKNHNNYSAGDKRESLLFCIENKIFNARYLINILDKADKNLTSENRITGSTMTIHGRRASRTITSRSYTVGETKKAASMRQPFFI